MMFLFPRLVKMLISQTHQQLFWFFGWSSIKHIAQTTQTHSKKLETKTRELRNQRRIFIGNENQLKIINYLQLLSVSSKTSDWGKTLTYAVWLLVCFCCHWTLMKQKYISYRICFRCLWKLRFFQSIGVCRIWIVIVFWRWTSVIA